MTTLPVPVRPRCRPVTRPLDDDPTSPEAARLRDVLVRVARGETQAEIAAAYGKSVRTVRGWIAEARRRGLKMFQDTTAADFLARTFGLQEYRRATLLKAFAAADLKGDAEALCDLERRLETLDAHQLALLDRIGVLQRYHHPPPAEEDEGVKGAHTLITMVRAVLEGPEAVDALWEDAPAD